MELHAAIITRLPDIGMLSMACRVPVGIHMDCNGEFRQKKTAPHVTKMNPPKQVGALIDCSSVLNNEGYLY